MASRKTLEAIGAEEWRPVPVHEFAAWYEVSSHGRIRSLHGSFKKRGVVGAILKPTPNRKGYLIVTLEAPHDGGPRRKHAFQLHVLVAGAFLGPRPAGMQVNHLDTNKANCAVANLEYATPLANMQHATRMGLRDGLFRGEKNSYAKLTTETVIEIRQRYAQGGVSQTALAAEYGISQPHVSSLIRGARWNHV